MAAQKSTKSEKVNIKADKRTVLGKKVKKLRSEGIVPANIYGQGFKSMAIQLNSHDFMKTFRQVGATTVMYIGVGSEEFPVMIHKIQLHPLLDTPLHIDFRKVDLKQKIEAEVPLKFVGEPDAVAHKKGDLLTLLDHVTVSALPDEVPHEIEIDLVPLKEVDEEIKVGMLPKGATYEIVTDPEQLIVRIAEHKEESVEPDTEVVAAEVIEEAPSEDGEAAGDDAGESKDDEAKTDDKEESSDSS